MSGRNGVCSYRRFLQGDVTALEELVREYGDALVRFAYCYVKDSAAAEDIMEDAFATLLVRRRHFSECDNLRAYLYKTVRNRCLDYLRKRKKQTPIADLENVLSTGSAEADLLAQERNETLYRCMQKLPPQYGEVLYLAYFEDCKTEEICKIVKSTKKQVYNLLSRAKTTLKELLFQEGYFYENE